MYGDMGGKVGRWGGDSGGKKFPLFSYSTCCWSLAHSLYPHSRHNSGVLLFDEHPQRQKNPRPNGYKQLKGRDGFRIRVADYRIIYDIFDHILTVDVIDLGHRKDIYE